MSGIVAESDVGCAKSGLVLDDVAGDLALGVEANADLSDDVSTGILG
jgi:hypothetical protein